MAHSSLLEATFAATGITHPNLQLDCRMSSCIVGNAGFHGRRISAIKKDNISVAFILVLFF